jgi:hypothetical protein
MRWPLLAFVQLVLAFGRSLDCLPVAHPSVRESQVIGDHDPGEEVRVLPILVVPLTVGLLVFVMMPAATAGICSESADADR